VSAILLFKAGPNFTDVAPLQPFTLNYPQLILIERITSRVGRLDELFVEIHPPNKYITIIIMFVFNFFFFFHQTHRVRGLNSHPCPSDRPQS
jgi:ABC-type transport system involved in cytochrome bd biosynthesis fused ATPase/permease subunit